MGSPPLRYTNSGAERHAKSAGESPFTRVAQVRASTLAERHQCVIEAMMKKNRFGDELWLSTESIQVIIGKVNHRRKDSEEDTRGRKLSPCTQAHRRTIQRRIDEVVRLGVLEEKYPANSLVPFRGHLEFRRSATYSLVPEKLTPRRTWDQYRASRPYKKPPQPASVPRQPDPPAPQPLTRGPIPITTPTSSRKLRELTRREREKLSEAILWFMKGDPGVAAYEPCDPNPQCERCEGEGKRKSGTHGLIACDCAVRAVRKGERERMNRKQATEAACRELLIPLDSALETLRLAGHSTEGE